MYADSEEVSDEFSKLNLAEQCDASYALRETITFLEDTLKDLRKKRNYVNKLACLAWLEEAEASGEQNRVGTPYCSAEPAIKHVVSLPYKRRNDPEAYDALMGFLGVSPELCEREVLRLNWEGFTSWFTDRQDSGLPLPPGVHPDKVSSEFDLSVRRRKDVDEEVVPDDIPF